MRSTDTDQLPRIAFLLGAGASISAGMPETGEITERVLSVSNIGRHSDGCYYLNYNRGWSEQYLRRIKVMLDLLKEEALRFYSRRQQDGSGLFNYEDIYYLARQINDHEGKSQDNPAILPFIEKISPAIEPYFDGGENEIINNWTLEEISQETVNYIRDVVRGMLSKEPDKLNHLNIIGDALREYKAIDIFTLNHDTVIEKYLSKEGIPFVDGFGAENGGVRYWDPTLFENGVGQVRLFKLHGAVNWFLYSPEGGTVLDERIFINNGYFPDVEKLIPLGGHPEILIGTYNKLIDYANEVFFDLRHLFYQSLLSTRHVIICGYSFGDHGINKMLDSWVKLPDRSLMVIDPDAQKFKEKTPKWVESRIRECWDELKLCGVLKCIPKRIENVSWEEINMELHESRIKDEIVDRETPLGFWRYASEYTEAAKHLNSQDRTSFLIPAYYLVTHGIELGFKAFLRAHGYSVENLKKLGHNLKRLVKTANKEGLPDVAPCSKEFLAAIDLINSYYKQKQLEYIKTGFKQYPPISCLIDGNESLLKNIKTLCGPRQK